MKLFLASSLGTTAKLLSLKIGNPKSWNVLFISNAADAVGSGAPWVLSDRRALIGLGYNLIDLDLREVDEVVFTEKLRGVDMIHFCGGSVVYLISLLRKQGLVDVLISAVRSGKVVYSGTSAGSMIVAEDLSLTVFDSEEQPFLKDFVDKSGLGLVNFLIFPHAQHASVVDSQKVVLENFPNTPYPILFLSDEWVVWSEDGKMEILKN